MRKKAIRGVLFSITSLAALTAHAGDADLRLIEELPVEQRVVVHEAVSQYFNQHPDAARDVKALAVGKDGTIYGLNEKLEKMVEIGKPSCGD